MKMNRTLSMALVSFVMLMVFGCGAYRHHLISGKVTDSYIKQPDGKMLVKYTRLYADASGVSHFEDIVVELKSLPFAPPAPPADVSTPTPASQFLFLLLKPGWYGDWHPAPRRQMMLLVAGECEVQVGDGEIRRVGPGSISLVEDITGKGHTTRVISNVNVLFAVVQLPD